MPARPVQRPLRRLSDHSLLSLAVGTLVLGALLGAVPGVGSLVGPSGGEGSAHVSAPDRDSDASIPRRPLRTDRANRW